MNEKSVKWVSLSVSQIFKCTFAASRWGRAGNAEKKRQKNGRRGIGCASVCLLQWWAPPPLPLSSSSPPFPSIPFPSSLPFSNPLPKPVVFQLFSQNQSNGTSCSTDPGMSPPGRRHGRPVFPSNGWPVLSPVVIFTRWMAGFFHRSYFSPSGWPVLSPVMSLTWWVAGFVTGDRR